MAQTVLFHVSDIHFGIEDRAALGWFEEAVEAEQPDAVICTGDITQRAKHREYAAASEWFAGLGVPVMLEVGNHDMPYYSPVERFRTPFRRYQGLASAIASRPAFPGLGFVSLLTTVSAQKRWPWSDGVIRQDALERALADLRKLDASGQYKIVTCHHPLVGRRLGGKNPTIGGDAAFAALAQAGADAVMSGHIHQPFDITHDVAGRKVRMIGAGTLSNRLRGAAPSFNVLRFDPGTGLAVECYEFPDSKA